METYNALPWKTPDYDPNNLSPSWWCDCAVCDIVYVDGGAAAVGECVSPGGAHQRDAQSRGLAGHSQTPLHRADTATLTAHMDSGMALFIIFKTFIKMNESDKHCTVAVEGTVHQCYIWSFQAYLQKYKDKCIYKL